MPTLCGLRRRGYTPSAIRNFIQTAGVSKAYSVVDIELLEHCIRDELNFSALRRIAVLDPLKVTVLNYPKEKSEYFKVPNNPQAAAEEVTYREVPFTGHLYIDRADFCEVPPPKFFRLKPGGEVRLMGAYIIKCTDIVKDAKGNITEILCTADLESKNMSPADGRKIKGTVHWLSENNAEHININIYDRLFSVPNVADIPEDRDYKEFLNSDSLTVYQDALIEIGVKEASLSEKFQFVRNGYFCRDKKQPDTFLQIVSLKDSYKPQ
ncbi:Glutamine--tRNA ligase [bioreactor metagenome]|uniref:Glutamine--tRNA ligase n=1 Tax=bioreactor metagenome TaxID=1076179 RepID=A0A645DDV9_9ZZZZ